MYSRRACGSRVRVVSVGRISTKCDRAPDSLLRYGVAQGGRARGRRNKGCCCEGPREAEMSTLGTSGAVPIMRYVWVSLSYSSPYRIPASVGHIYYNIYNRDSKHQNREGLQVERCRCELQRRLLWAPLLTGQRHQVNIFYTSH